MFGMLGAMRKACATVWMFGDRKDEALPNIFQETRVDYFFQRVSPCLFFCFCSPQQVRKQSQLSHDETFLFEGATKIMQMFTSCGHTSWCSNGVKLVEAGSPVAAAAAGCFGGRQKGRFSRRNDNGKRT